CGVYAIGGGVLDGVERRRHQIRDVGQQVERDDENRTERQRQRNIAAWVLHLARGEGDVVPGIRGEERPGLRDAEGHEQAERAERRDARRDRLEAARRPQVTEVGGERGRVAADEDARRDEGDERSGLGRREDVLDDLAVFQA